MMSYIKSFLVGTPKEEEKKQNDSLLSDDIAKILSQDDIIDILSSELIGTVTLYELKGSQ